MSGGNADFYYDWKHAKQSDRVEGYIVKLADLASVVFKVWHEVLLLGNNSFARVAHEVYDSLSSIEIPNYFESDICNFFVDVLRDMIFILEKAIEHTERLADIVASPIKVK